MQRYGVDEAVRQRLADAGLIVERERGQLRDGERHYDRFRDRIMFPIRDARGRVIAFGAPLTSRGGPKYPTTPPTPPLSTAPPPYPPPHTTPPPPHPPPPRA